MNKKLSVLRRITAVVLCVTLLSSQVVVANAEDSERMNVQTNSEITDISEQDGFDSDTSEISDITESDIPDSFEGESEQNTDISTEVTEKFGNSEDQGFTDGEETIIEDENTSDTLEEANPDYEEGKICIYNYQQLLQIGTGTQMFSGDKDGNVGEGDKVLADGAELTYASDASYCLMNDIPIDNENVWNFPSDFTGSITSSSERTGNTVYDSVTDTIYVYNRYQLELMKGESSDSEPVMSEDYIAEKVGMGQVFTLEDGTYLTYSKTHNYVLASSFTTETPELLANKAGTEETTKDITSAYPSDYEGRNYFGQVVKKIGDKNYILIGNETQLRAIGTDADVTEPIWRVYETREKNEGILGGYTDWKPAADTSEYKTELYYPGDADIVKFNDTYNWSGKELYANKNGAHKLNDTEYLDKGYSGGFIGECISGRARDTRISSLKTVTASAASGKAGGFAGFAKAGDALSAGDSTTSKLTGIELENLLGVVSALRPEFNNTSIAYVSNGSDPQVSADMAGGFVGDGQAVDINYGNNNSGFKADTDTNPSSSESTGEKNSEEADFISAVTNSEDGTTEGETGAIATTNITGLSYIKGTSYAGGFAGRLMPGDVAQTGSIKLLGLLNVNQLLSVMDVAYPRISDSSIEGDSLVVTASGKNDDVALGDAGGYIGNGKAVMVKNSDVTNVKEVTAPYHAGGYIGIMRSGSAAEAGDATGDLLNSVLGKILSLKELASVLQAASSKITNCKVAGTADGLTVTADRGFENAEGYAGGFVGEMQSGHVDNSSNAVDAGKGTAVENLLKVEGLRYAGGFGGLVKAGAVAEIGDKSSILTKVVDLTGLLSLVNAFVPVISNASVNSVEKGFTVTVTGTLEKDSTNDADAGSAGGFIGCGTGVQISNSDVNKLQHTGVSEPKNLQQEDGSSYYGSDSAYAVSGYRYAGGYIGKAAMGSTAAIGGASVLDHVLSASNLLSALTVVASIIDSSDVYGATGGFNVLATNGDGNTGKAGGYAGELLGVQIQNSNSYNFAHIIGRESAGGYVGTMEPGSAADVVGGLSALGGLISADNLLGVLQAFVPVIKNSETTCVPCGGAVRAQAESDDGIYRGLAGGYAGYNYGGQIWGNNTDNWKGSAYTGTTRECAAYRIRSVYGTEYAGGYTGLMRCANVADTGSLKVLFGLIKLDNPLTLLQAVYPTEKNTAVYGPLRGLDTDTWNKWVGAVGSYGSYGNKLQALGEVNDQEQLNEIISQYAYGYAVTAGRSILASKATQGGSAGGYVGRMEGGTVTNGTATDLQSVEAFRSSGGFAGEMLTGSVANTGDVSLAGLKIIGADSLAALKTFVPVVKQSHVEGYRSGARIKATDIADKDPAGFAGGYVGRMIGGQIWGDGTNSCRITNLRRVDGTSYVGGFAGKVDPGSVAAIDTATKQGLLNKLLDVLMVNAPAELIKVLNATVSTIRCASVSAWDDWGVIVNGTYQNGSNTGYAKAAGGFAGSLCGAVLGEKDKPESGIRADKIRSVVAGEYAGGCFGIADVSGAANISAGNETSVLQYLLKLGKTDVLDAFRSYVYYGNVTGSPDAGLGVSANTATDAGQNNQVTYSGTAGGFGGSLLNGSVKNSSVTGLNYVTGLNSVGGFVGYSGKSGVVKMEKLDVLGDKSGQLLGGALGVLDIFGSHIDDSRVTGVPGGYTVQSKGGKEQIAGGFIGYANLARMSGCNAGDDQNQENSLKLVESGGTAGGFAGRTSFAYLADVKLDSTVVDALFVVLDQLVRALYLDKIQDSDLLHINLGIVKVDALYEGNLLHVNLLGLDISVGLSKMSADNDQQTDFAIIKIGDSSIKLPCDKNGIITKDNDVKSNISVNLIKANRTKITDSNVYGISAGYDVYAGGAGNEADGTATDGRSGGFVGYNDEGLLKNNNMYYCDVVRGTSKLVGPFSGKSDLDSAYDFNTKLDGCGRNKTYRSCAGI